MNRFIFVIATMLAVITSSCDTEEPRHSESSSSDYPSQTISQPSFDKFLSTTDYDGFDIRVRFKTGGDKESNLSAKVHWQAFAKKPTSTPTKSDLSHVESMRQYGSATYHNTGAKKGMTESVVYDKSHGGYSGGTYIYYYVECTNSKGTAESPMTHIIVARF